ncbi:MAG: hypothetical protein IKW39_00285 [Alphaproteobacteria bacterium]|nr:hypothetical protein [Alphaproteobacteria bacterium]
MASKIKKLRFLSLFWDYTSALSLILLLILLWHLGKGPIEVNFLRPYIIEALTNETSSYDINISSVNLELANSIQPIEIIAKDISFKDKEDSYEVTSPRLSLSFSARALLKGLLAPSSIDIENPKVRINTSYEETFKNQHTQTHSSTDTNLKKLEFYFNQFEELMERFNSPEKLYIESFINEINIKNSSITIKEVDTQKEFHFVNADLSFLRGLTSIELKLDSAIGLNDSFSGLDIKLKYNLLTDQITYASNFSDLFLTNLYDVISPKKGDLKTLDIPINAELNAIIDFGNILKNKDKFAENIGSNIKEINFHLEGGQGKIGFLNNDDFDYDISSFNLKGSLHGKLDKVDIKNATIDFNGKKAKISLSATGFKDYLLHNNLENFKLNIKTQLGAFDMDELSALWPRYLGEKAWSWCNESLYGGKISNGKFSFNFGFDDKTKTFGLQKLDGTAEIKDANLDYLEGMPVIKNVYGTAHFSNNKIEIFVDKGVSDNVILTGGNVVLYDLDKENNFIRITLKGNSTITDALKLIDNPPLGFTKEMGINPNNVNGDVEIDLGLDFELKSNLSPEEIKVTLNGDLSNIEYLGLEDDKTFIADSLKLYVTEKGFSLNGTAKYQDVPLKLSLTDNFKDNANKSKIIADISINDEILQKLGIKASILSAPYFTGSSDIKATIIFQNTGKIELFVDGSLKNTAIDYAFLGFAKDKGEPCHAKAKMIINNNKIEQVTEFSLIKAQWQAKGNIKMTDKGLIKTIDITEIKAPKAFAKAKVDFTYSPKLKLKVTLNGDSYDLTDFFNSKKQSSEITLNKKEKSLKDPLEDVMDTDIIIGVNKLWTNNQIPVTNFAGKLELRNGIGVHRINMIGNYAHSKDVTMKLDFEPRGKEYILTIDSNNAGSTLKVLRLYDHMKGGNLKIEAKRDIYKNFKGFAQMRDFSLSDTPIFAKLLSLSSLAGIVDMLTGEGLRFTHLNAPFSYTFSTKNLETTDAKIFGPVLGLKLTGKYNLFDDIIEARGLIIPAYNLNKFIGNIPLVGKILRGEDGTVFATNYQITGTTEKPQIIINPLSTLAPNSVKELFSSGE